MVVLQKCPKLRKGGWAFVDLHQIVIGHGHPRESVTWKKLSLVMAEGNQVSGELRANGSWYFQPLGTGTSALERSPGWRASVSIIRRQGHSHWSWGLSASAHTSIHSPFITVSTSEPAGKNFVSQWDPDQHPYNTWNPASTHTHRLTLLFNMPWNTFHLSL